MMSNIYSCIEYTLQRKCRDLPFHDIVINFCVEDKIDKKKKITVQWHLAISHSRCNPLSLISMSSTSNLEYEKIPKRYIDPLAPKDKSEGSRVNGKDWKIKKDAFRVKTLGVAKKSSFKERELKKLQEQQYKERLKELKEEKESAKKQKIDDLKRRREIKAEKERHEKLAAKMHQKKVERLKKREKRNKLLKER